MREVECQKKMVQQLRIFGAFPDEKFDFSALMSGRLKLPGTHSLQKI